LDAKLKSAFRLIQQEVNILLPALQPVVSTPDDASSDRLDVNARSDQQFWLLRRVSELALAAGFIELTQGQAKSTRNWKKLYCRSYEPYFPGRGLMRGRAHQQQNRMGGGPPNRESGMRKEERNASTKRLNSPSNQDDGEGKQEPRTPAWIPDFIFD
uniref:RUN domain-containing protein n=1 Tax=Echinostoma caproni TaxID=27848 RepID=A0A183AQ84_9TREM